MRRTKADKLGELEDQIKGLERRTDELRAERDAANALIGRMREHRDRTIDGRELRLLVRHAGES